MGKLMVPSWYPYGTQSLKSFCYRRNTTSNGQPAEAAAAAELYVNQMVSSSLHWQDVGLHIKQTASFQGPKNTALTKLEILSDSSEAASPQAVIKLRVPGWVHEGTAEVREAFTYV